MSRPISHPGLAALLAFKKKSLKELAADLGCNRSSVYEYVWGRKRLRWLEQRWVDLWGIGGGFDVHVLRRWVRLPPIK